jgi:predicted PurR-regulated permease PerM
MTGAVKFPFYAKISFISIALFVFVYTLYIGQAVILPIAYALIFSILLTPLVGFFEKMKLKRIFAITFSLLLAILFTVGLIYFVSSQLGMFERALPMMREKFKMLQDQAVQWIAVHFNISIQKIEAWFVKSETELSDQGNSMIGKTLLNISSFLVVLFLIPVYVFMILYYEPLLLLFSKKLFNKEHHPKLETVLFKTKAIIQSYLSGLLIEALIIATLNATALLMIGIDYAILLGIIGALLNMIPFIGGIIAVALPMTIAFLTKDTPYSPILVVLSYMLIQFIDNHYITPKVVASKVKINALVAVVVVLIGNAIWGIAGMFLAIPLTGILKVVFENIDSLKPWAFLLGDTMPSSAKYIFNFRRKKEEGIRF